VIRATVIRLICRTFAIVLYLTANVGIAADTILYNGKIVTIDSNFTIAEAVAIADGRILQVGSNSNVRKLAGAETRLIDLGGKTVTPGFIDTHPHMIHVGSGAANVVLADVTSIVDIQKKIAERVASTPDGEWIFTSSISDPRKVRELPGSLQERRWPTRFDLDKVAPNHPVHIPTPWGGPKPAVLNSRALALLGITADTPEFDKGIQILRDDATGKPNGLILGMHAYNYNPYYARIMSFAPRHPAATVAAGVERHIRAFNSRGLTAVYESHYLTDANIEAIGYLLETDRLNVRLKLAPEFWGAAWQPANAIDAWFTRLLESPPLPDGDKVRMLGATLSSDGPISFGKAMMNVPYWNMDGEPSSIRLPLTAEQITKVAMLAAEHDVRMNFPVGGDRMADTVLDALEAVDEVYPLAGRHWLIAHTPYMTTERLQRIKRLGMDVTANSNAEYKMTRDIYAATFRHLADEMASINTPWRWLLESGIVTAQSTDNVFADPMFTLWHAVKRSTETPGESLLSPGKAISREDALRLQTINGARVLQWDDEIGSIQAGKFADLVVLDTDILTCDLDDIRDARVLATYLGGELVYSDPEIQF
jgi:predicted amidohydrolase YtcJ